MAADCVVHAHRPERDEEAGMRIGNDRLAAVLFQLLDDLRRLPLRAGQVNGVASRRAADDTFDAELDAAAASVKSEVELAELLGQLETQMREAAKKFEFEKAAQLRDKIKSLKQQDLAGLFSKDAGEAAASATEA